MSKKPIFSCVRTKPIKSMQSLVSMDRHGRRQDKSCEARCDFERSQDNLAWSSSPAGDPLDVIGAFKHRKAETNAKEYAKAPIALHMLLTVSPEWIQASGDMHDPRNPKNQMLFDQAKKWAEEKFGPGSVIAARMDMDESGGGVVDVFVVPVHQVKQRGKTKNQISVNKAYEAAFGGGRVYGKMQDSWASHCQEHLDQRITRGRPKEETGAEYVEASIIAPKLEKVSKREKAISAREKRVATREEQAAEVLEKPWWKPVRETTKTSVLKQAERNEIRAWYQEKYESVTVKLGEVSTRLAVERQKREKLENQNRALGRELLNAMEKNDKLECAIAEVAEEIPMSALQKLKLAFGASRMLDDVMSALGIKKREEPVGVRGHRDASGQPGRGYDGQP